MKLRRRRERPSLPRTVTELVAEDGSRVYVVGTAHFSDDSKKDVAKVRTGARGWPQAERPLPVSHCRLRHHAPRSPRGLVRFLFGNGRPVVLLLSFALRNESLPWQLRWPPGDGPLGGSRRGPHLQGRGSVLAAGQRAELARPLQTIREVQPDVVVVELCQYRVSMLKMDESTLLQEAKEISLEKLQQAVRQVRRQAGVGCAPLPGQPRSPLCPPGSTRPTRQRGRAQRTVGPWPGAGEGLAFVGFQTREVRWVSFIPQGRAGQGPQGPRQRGGWSQSAVRPPCQAVPAALPPPYISRICHSHRRAPWGHGQGSWGLGWRGRREGASTVGVAACPRPSLSPER